MSTPGLTRSLLAAIVFLGICPNAEAQDESYKPEVKTATEEPQKAIKSLRVAPGFQVELFASEPLLANPVAFHVDEKGRFYVIETFRHSEGVTDTRGHMNWLDDDLASRTVSDRVKMYKKFFTADEFAKYSKEQDRIRLIEDTNGDGKADKATIFADGFSLPETGLGAGVLARKGNVYFACIPDLWLLRDTNGDGKADERKVLHTGYGVHVGFLGHDLHGLIFGPDGKLYFSIGDRGFNVTTLDGKHMAVIDTGSVLRCDPDGHNLEVVATGLRNPQELAFTETGDLFSVDNNSDGGDKARLVQIIEGADSGWRIGYQFIEEPNSRGIWNSEKMWYPKWDGQAAYILPPLANFTDGPSGLTYYPGTGLNSSQKGRFYISDFRGAPGSSGIRSFKLKPKGSSFELVEPEEFLWGFEVTDCDFGPDGALYATDWVNGWNKNGKGRIWKVSDPNEAKNLTTLQTQKLIAEGTDKKSIAELENLLPHPDMRVRQAAQFALAELFQQSESKRDEVLTVLKRVALSGKDRLPRLHAIWGLGQIGQSRAIDAHGLIELILALRSDADDEIRAQAAKTIGWMLVDSPKANEVDGLIAFMKDPSPRVRMYAVQTAGRWSLFNIASVLEPLLSLLRTEEGRDPTFRTVASVALAPEVEKLGLGGDHDAISPHLEDRSPNVRMALLLAARRQLAKLTDKPEALGMLLDLWAKNRFSPARFLEDSDPAIVLEAARVLTELPEISRDLPKLAALAGRASLSDPLARRVLAACEATGDVEGLVAVASRGDVGDSVRVESLRMLSRWMKPMQRHPLTGLARKVEKREAAPAVAALLPAIASLVTTAPETVRQAAAKAAGELGMKEAAPTLRALVVDSARPAESRVEALRALDALKDDKLADVAQSVLNDPEPGVRVEAVRAYSKSNPDRSIEILTTVLENGPIQEKQGAFSTLADLKNDKADVLLNAWLDKLVAGNIAPEIRLDVTEAAAKRELKEKLALYESSLKKDDPLSTYRDSLVGGNAARGRRVFREKAEAQCLRCHKVDGDGGEVGPELTGISSKKDRAYILESIVLPNKQIAQGFETTLLAKKDGQVVSGIVKGEDDKEVRLITAEGKLISVPKSEIEEKTRGNSAMPEDMIKSLSKSELRDVIEFLMSSKAPADAK